MDKPVSTTSEEKKITPQEEKEARQDLFKAILICLLAVVAVRSFFFEPFKIPSSSMVPTLKIGDHIFVSKFSYGLSFPFTKVEFATWGAPKRGDVIVFLFPRDESLHYVKRVVGVPGDTIEFKGRDLWINGEAIKKELVTDPSVFESVIGQPAGGADLYKEWLGNSVHYVKYNHAVSQGYSLTKLTDKVPDDKFFVVGDNRDDSYDSRSWGFVPRANIKGKAQVIWLSLDQEQGWSTMAKVRWSRCGSLIN